MSECSGLFGQLFGHKFEAVYDDAIETGKFEYPEEVFPCVRLDLVGFTNAQKLHKRTYRGSVCKRCGETVNVPEERLGQ